MSFDREELLEEYEDDTETLAHMIGIFDRDYSERLPKLRAAVESGDWDTVMNEAHALKGGLGNFFADDSYATAQQLESAGKEGGAADATEILQTLEAEIQAFRKDIGTLIGE